MSGQKPSNTHHLPQPSQLTANPILFWLHANQDIYKELQTVSYAPEPQHAGHQLKKLVMLRRDKVFSITHKLLLQMEKYGTFSSTAEGACALVALILHFFSFLFILFLDTSCQLQPCRHEMAVWQGGGSVNICGNQPQSSPLLRRHPCARTREKKKDQKKKKNWAPIWVQH